MRILVAHNFYGNYATGGEGFSTQADVDLLESYGHEVLFHKRTNSEFRNLSFLKKMMFPFSMIYSSDTYREVTRILKDFKPDVLHVHNYKFLFSPSIFQAAHDCGVKTVLSIRNYRLMAPCGLLCCNSRACERCVKGFPFRILWNRCFPHQDCLFGRALCLYYYFGTSRRVAHSDHLVDAFIALTSFAKGLLVDKGIPSKKIYVRPNFITPAEFGSMSDFPKIGAIYVGRLSSEKGVEFLIDAWRSVSLPLTVVGTGPLEERLKKDAPSNVTFTGDLSHNEAMSLLARADFLVFPSVCYESFGLTIVESFSMKVPVIASDLGPRRDLVRHGENGLLFESLNADDFINKIQKTIDDPALRHRLGAEGERTFMENYTPEINYKRLLKIYEDVVSGSINGDISF